MGMRERAKRLRLAGNFLFGISTKTTFKARELIIKSHSIYLRTNQT